MLDLAFVRNIGWYLLALEKQGHLQLLVFHYVVSLCLVSFLFELWSIGFFDKGYVFGIGPGPRSITQWPNDYITFFQHLHLTAQNDTMAITQMASVRKIFGHALVALHSHANAQLVWYTTRKPMVVNIQLWYPNAVAKSWRVQLLWRHPVWLQVSLFCTVVGQRWAREKWKCRCLWESNPDLAGPR